MTRSSQKQASRVLVAMSGGVDSSVAAALMVEAGHDVIGVTMHLWDAEGEQKIGRCCAPEDRDDARRTCDVLGIPHYVLDERTAFREHVVDPFMKSYGDGLTPSPCVSCNQHVKLTRLIEVADAMGCSHVVTGHYARLVRSEAGDVSLLRGVDHGKDQSYFLFGVPQQVLRRLWFPLGALNKTETREHGRRLFVPNADKPDSQELCFVSDGDVAGFIKKQGKTLHPGVIKDEAGQVLAHHEGVEQFTVGKRRGLGLSGGAAKYVLRIVPETHEIVVGDDASLLSDRVTAKQVVWLNPNIQPNDGKPFHALVRVRYRHTPALAEVIPTADGFTAVFETPQRALAPGQAAVIYTGDQVVGGGYITN